MQKVNRERETDRLYIDEVYIHICISYGNSMVIDKINKYVTKEKHCNCACAPNTSIFESMGANSCHY